MRYEDIPALDQWKLDCAASPASPSQTSAHRNPLETQKLTGWKHGGVSSVSPAPTNQISSHRNPLETQKLAGWKHGGVSSVSPAPTNQISVHRNIPVRRNGFLDTIDHLIDLYHKAFSPMAKTNVLNDLRRAIDSWHQACPGPLPAAMAALKSVVDRKLDLRPSAERYNTAICIAYHAGCNYDKATKTTHTNMNDWDKNVNYFRHSKDDATDMQRKCEHLWAGIQAAQAGIATHNLASNQRTLKIFMAPEFYFRGKNGAYPIDTVSEIIPKMMSLGTAKPLYSDWLFVFGTAVASFEVNKTRCSICGSNPNTIRFKPDPQHPGKTIPKCSTNSEHAVETKIYGAEVQNVALIQHGSDSHMIIKEYVSNIDYTNNVVRNATPEQIDKKQVTHTERGVIAPLGGHQNPGKPGNRPGKAGRPGTMAVQNDERLGGCVFTMDGLTIGLEVCLDHAVSMGVGGPGRAAALAPTIHILLIPSYGMQIDTGLYCRTNGIAFNVDGHGGGISEVKLNTPPYNPQPARVVSDKISLYGPFNIPT